MENEIEKKITDAIANTYNFELKGKYAKCRICGRILNYSFVGMHVNERMIQHFESYHIRRDRDNKDGTFTI